MATPVSHFVKTVCLRDWWLTKAENNSEGNTVAVAGIESAGRQAARVFFSAPIVKRLDLFTLKTADGIFVLLRGPINKQQTSDNGFSEEVFKHFLVGFPSDWEKCAEKCFEQGTGPEATSDAEFNPGFAKSELNAVTEMGNATFKLRQPFSKDPVSTDRPENFRDEAEEVDIQLQDDQNIHSVEERSFEDPRSHAQDHNEDVHVTVSCHDKYTCYDNSSVGFREEGVRYNLRNREVPHIEVAGVYNGKHVKNIAGGRSFSKKTMVAADNSMQNIRDENENMPLTPDCIGSRNLKTQRRHTHDDTTPTEANANSTPQETGKLKNSDSHHSYGGKSYQSKKRKGNQRSTAKSTVKKNIARTRSLLKKTGANADASNTSPVTLENSTQCGVIAPGGNSMQNQNGRAEDKSMRQTPGRLRSARPNVHKRITREDNAPLDVFSFQGAEELEAPMSHLFCAGKSYESKKQRNKRSILTKNTADSKNSRDSARSASKTCTSNVKNNPKTAVAKRGGTATQESTPKKKTKRRLDYAEQTTPTAEGGKKGPNDFSQSSELRTSRSGRLLLPTMEFWRNQLPIYDADHGISGIRDGSTVLKFRRGRKSRHSESGPESL